MKILDEDLEEVVTVDQRQLYRYHANQPRQPLSVTGAYGMALM